MFALQAEVGNKWAEIARRLPGRTESSVKNRYYSALRRVQRACGGDADEAAALLSTFAQMQVVRLGVTTGRAASGGATGGAGHMGAGAGDAPAYDAAGKRLQFEDEVLKAMEKEGKGVAGPGEESKAMRSRLLSSWLAAVGPAGLCLATTLLPGGTGTEQVGSVTPVPRLQLHRYAGSGEQGSSAADASSGLSHPPHAPPHMVGGTGGAGSSRSASKMAKRADGRTARTAGGSARRGKASARAATPPLVPHADGGEVSSSAMRGHEAMGGGPSPSSSSSAAALSFNRAAAWDPTARPLSPATSVEGELGMDVCAVGESTLELPAFPPYAHAHSSSLAGASGGRVVQGAKGGVAPLRLGAVNGRYMQESPQVMWNGSESTAPAASFPSARAVVEESWTPGRKGGKSKLPTLDRIIAVPVPVRPGKDGLPVPVPCGSGGGHGEAPMGVVMVPTVMVRQRPTGAKRHRQPSLDSSDYSSSSSYSSDEEVEGTARTSPQAQSQGGYGSAARLMAGIWGPVAGAPRAATPTGFPVAAHAQVGGMQQGTPVRVGGVQGLSPLAHSSAGNSRSASALAAVLGATGLDTPVRLSSAPAAGGPAFSFSSSRSAVRSPADLLLPMSGALPAIPAAWSSHGYGSAGGSERTVPLSSPPVLTPLRPLDLPFRLAPHPSAEIGTGASSGSGGTAGSPVHPQGVLALTATIAREGGGDKAVDRWSQDGQEAACSVEQQSPREQPLLQMLAAAAGFD